MAPGPAGRSVASLACEARTTETVGADAGSRHGSAAAIPATGPALAPGHLGIRICRVALFVSLREEQGLPTNVGVSHCRRDRGGGPLSSISPAPAERAAEATSQLPAGMANGLLDQKPVSTRKWQLALAKYRGLVAAGPSDLRSDCRSPSSGAGSSVWSGPTRMSQSAAPRS